MAGIYRDPPITYKSSFDSSKPKLVTLSIYDAEDHSDSVKVPLFTDKGGLEELLHTEEAFLNAVEDLNIANASLIRYFGRCLCVDAQTKWRTLTRATRPNNQRLYPLTRDGYNSAFSAFIKLYCNAEDARDIMHIYLRSSACKKKIEPTCKDHTDRIMTLIKYTAKLHGFVANLDHLQTLTILLHSYPNSWIEDYVRIHLKLTPATTAQFIVDHMSSLDRLSKQKNKNNGRRPNSSNSNNNKKRSNNQKSNQNNKKKSNPCRIPGHNHDWSECPKNKFSKNYKGSNHNKGANSTTTKNFHTQCPEACGSNESFQAHMRAAMESYHSQHGGRTEKSIDGELVWLP